MRTDTYRRKALDDLSALVPANSPAEVWRESRETLALFLPDADFTRLKALFSHTVSLFRGEMPDYRECNTGYHDLRHTTDVFLALTRLLHGMSIIGSSLPLEQVDLTLSAALLHDVGYIQRSDDTHGTGAKYTLSHIQRGMDYADNHMEDAGFSRPEITRIKRLIMATDITVNFHELGMESTADLYAAKAIFSADILGQMADRIYLEKLLFLYREFAEAGIQQYSSENDLIEKTHEFYRMVWATLFNEADYDTRCMKAHFRERWDDDRDLYVRAVDNNMSFLLRMLSQCMDGNYRSMLKREGMVEKLRKLEATSDP